MLAGLPNAPSRLALTNDMQGAVARGHHDAGDHARRGLDQRRRPDRSAGHARRCWRRRPTPARATRAMCSTRPPPRRRSCPPAAAPDLVVKTTIDPALQTLGTTTLRDVIAKQGAHRSVTPRRAGDAGAGRRDPGDGRRARPRQEPVQPRRPGPPPAGLVVQGVRLRRGGRARGQADRHPPGRADQATPAGHPENYGHGYAGAVTLASALARSLNTVSVRLTLEVGPDAVARLRPPAGPRRHPAASGPIDRARRL